MCPLYTCVDLLAFSRSPNSNKSMCNRCGRSRLPPCFNDALSLHVRSASRILTCRPFQFALILASIVASGQENCSAEASTGSRDWRVGKANNNADELLCNNHSFSSNSTIIAAADTTSPALTYKDDELDLLLDQLKTSSLMGYGAGRDNHNDTRRSRRRKRRQQRQHRRQLEIALTNNSTRRRRWRRQPRNLLASSFRRRSFRLLDNVLDKFVSSESAGAIQAIRRILRNFETDHGVVDVFSMYSTREILLSGLALSRLQSAALAAEERGCVGDSENTSNGAKRSRRRFFGISSGGTRTKGNSGDGEDARECSSSASIDVDLLEMIAHYAKFAVSAYGWKGRLALSGRLHFGNVRALEARTGIDRLDIIDANWRSRTHRPAYFIVRDVQRKKIILCIRGTWSPRDVLTDLCCTAEDFEVCNLESEAQPSPKRRQRKGQQRARKTEKIPRAHHGMVESAKEIAKSTIDTIKSALAWNNGYSLVIIGHSLGCGIGAVLGTMWKEIFPGLTVLAYGCPCVGPLGTEPTESSAIISIVAERDPFSCLSIGHLADISAALSSLCTNTDLRDDILRRSRGSVNKMSINDLRWCHDAMEWLRKEYMTSEKLYPPGRVLYLRGSNLLPFGGNITLAEVPTSRFRELKLHARMFDLSRHIPTRYESALEKVWVQASVQNGRK